MSTPQAPYEGSDRQARGAVLRALADRSPPGGEFPARIVDGLVADRLVVRTGDLLHSARERPSPPVYRSTVRWRTVRSTATSQPRSRAEQQPR